MGYGSYNFYSRSARAKTEGFFEQSFEDTSTQTKEKRVHDLMNPKGVTFRECNDSEEHPYTVPIQLYLDVTGSMGSVPQEMIRDGLPTLMSTLIQSGLKDASLMFGGIGDHVYDRGPLQIGQFESGDLELDTWLKRTWLEKGGGGNQGESYLLAYYFGGNHVKTDSFDKRGKKGFLITIGDEPPLMDISLNSLKAIMGESCVLQESANIKDLLKKAQERNHVYHFHLEHTFYAVSDIWKDLLGQNLIVINDHKEFPIKLAQLISEKVNSESGTESKLNIDKTTKITL